MRPPAADRILVIRLGALGDVARTLPAVSAVRAAYPGAHIAWMVDAAWAEILTGQPFVDEIIVLPRHELCAALAAHSLGRFLRESTRFARALRRRRFELVLDFHSILRSGVLSRLSGAPVRVGYARPFGRELAWAFANRRARLAPGRISRFERNAALVRFLGVECEAAYRPLRIPPEALARAVAAPAGAAPIAIHPGTSDATPYKRYTAHGYARVARALAADVGVPCIVTRGPSRDDPGFARAIVDASEGAARLAPDTPTLADLAALFAACRLAIASDTGPLHVASLVGTPVVQLFGPTDPVENAPWDGSPSRSLRTGLACSPCRRGCAAATCMRSLSPDDVIYAARELLAETAGAAVATGRG
jgi:ADP-heptose:LPS heptosyltransferase